MVRPSGMVGVGLLVLSLPQQAAGMTLKQKQRAACKGMSTGAGCNYTASKQTVRGNCGMDNAGDNCCSEF
eukprot:jgi/Undpi1/4429/HiC_scaffold_17.g07783.m1